MKTRNNTIDVIRILACFSVILCHIHFPGTIGRYCMALSRFAVPYFMMITGWYIYKENSDDMIKAIKRSLYSILKITIISTIFISIINTIVSLIEGKNAFDWFFSYWKEEDLSTFILYNRARFLSSVMWYLFAMIYVLLFYLIIVKFKLLKIIYWIIIPLIILNLFRGEVLHKDWFYSGNWLFTGIPFTLIGTYMRSKINNYIFGIFVLIGIFVTAIEVHNLSEIFFYIGTTPLAIGLFGWAMKNDQLVWPKWLISFGKNCTPKIFILHCSLRDLIYAIFGTPNNIILWLMPFCFFALSGLVAIILNILIKKINYLHKIA